MKFTPAEQRHLQKLGLQMMFDGAQAKHDEKLDCITNISHWLESAGNVSWRFDPDTEEHVFSKPIEDLFWFDDENFEWRPWGGDSPSFELGESEGEMEAWRFIDDKAAYALCAELPCPKKTSCIVGHKNCKAQAVA